jgi:hypothetical protein
MTEEVEREDRTTSPSVGETSEICFNVDASVVTSLPETSTSCHTVVFG